MATSERPPLLQGHGTIDEQSHNDLPKKNKHQFLQPDIDRNDESDSSETAEFDPEEQTYKVYHIIVITLSCFFFQCWSFTWISILICYVIFDQTLVQSVEVLLHDDVASATISSSAATAAENKQLRVCCGELLHWCRVCSTSILRATSLA